MITLLVLIVKSDLAPLIPHLILCIFPVQPKTFNFRDLDRFHTQEDIMLNND
jgi:hypothetical protein